MAGVENQVRHVQDWIKIGQRRCGNQDEGNLTHLMGQDSEHLVRQLCLSDEKYKGYELVLQKFDSHCTPQRNVIHKRAMLQ